MDDAIAAWEDEGGSSARTGEHRMAGTENQIAWAVQIYAQVDASKPMNVCDEKKRLLRGHQKATRVYSDAVTELNARIGRSSRAEYEGLRRAVEDARKNSTVALKTLDDHVADHDC